MKAKSVPLRKMYKALIRMIKNRKETQFFYIRNKKIRHNYKNYGHWQNTHIYYELFNTHEFGYLNYPNIWKMQKLQNLLTKKWIV